MTTRRENKRRTIIMQVMLFHTRISYRLVLAAVLSVACLLPVKVRAAVASDDLERLYGRLDHAIDSSSHFTAQREMRIKRLRFQLRHMRDARGRLGLTYDIYKEYAPYINDSAMVYIKKCVGMAFRMKNKRLEGFYQSQMAYQCSRAGLYNEALSVLGQVSRDDLDRRGKAALFTAYNHLYGELASYTTMPEMRKSYFHLMGAYRDSMYTVMEKWHPKCLERRINDLLAAARYREALRLNNLQLRQTDAASDEYAIVAWYRYCIYAHMGELEKAKRWLVVSALCDTRHAIMDQAALWTLADTLSREGQKDRPYRYISFAWECAQTFGTRVRSWQISPILSVIDHNYQKQAERKNNKLRFFAVLVSALAFALVGLLYYLNKQRRKLAEAQNVLTKNNEELAKLNGRLSDLNKTLDDSNRKLSHTNSRLNETNRQLNESNRVKEAYIGRFIGICSLYIDKMESFRKHVNKLMLNHKYDEVFTLSKSADIKNREIDELFQNFDEVFLTLFPNFVSDFNNLLRPENRIKIVSGKKLTTPLRVFALIRLGIDDSSKIADFLHYSVNTIYNYRAQIKNNAMGNRCDFEMKVKQLGMKSE